MEKKGTKSKKIETKKEAKEAKTTKARKSSATKVRTTKDMPNEKWEKYLPRGTVVMLEGGKKRVMITGFGVSERKDPKKTWDYCGCIYPEGVISAETMMLFNHQQITEVYHLGYVDEEQLNFEKNLIEILQLKKEYDF